MVLVGQRKCPTAFINMKNHSFVQFSDRKTKCNMNYIVRPSVKQTSTTDWEI